MILVDTSIWIDHLRKGDITLIELLNANKVLAHPFVIGEIACGNLNNRKEILSMLDRLPKVKTAENEEVLYFISENGLMGRGIGFIDAHLLASTLLMQNTFIWTRDKRLSQVASHLTIAYQK